MVTSTIRFQGLNISMNEWKTVFLFMSNKKKFNVKLSGFIEKYQLKFWLPLRFRNYRKQTTLNLELWTCMLFPLLPIRMVRNQVQFHFLHAPGEETRDHERLKVNLIFTSQLCIHNKIKRSLRDIRMFRKIS